MMLARAMSLSIRAAEARGEMEAAESGGGGGGQRKMRLLQANGSLPIDAIDRVLWAGAAEQGWDVRPRSVQAYLRDNTRCHYFYITPNGTRFRARNAALASPEGQSDRASAALAAGAGDAGGDDIAYADGMAVVTAESDEDEELDEAPAVMLVGQASLLEQASRSAQQIAAAARASHAASAAAALADRGGDSSGSDDEEGAERCMIWGCRRRLLR